MALRNDYAGDFDPDLGLADLGRQLLADLGREYLLNGHLQDRVSLPLVAQRFGGDAYVQFSIEEWMGASPVYSKRMQRALRFEGDEVGTVFKNLQLDIGAPAQFMDFRFQLDAPDSGEFWLAHCGALLDVEPFGERQVKLMCHDIEDPTFDATAAATHPCMKMRPIHRPPRRPADRMPHCRWRVFIDHDDPVAYQQHPNLEIVSASLAARVETIRPERDAEPGGWADYSGAFDPDFQLEDLSHSALVLALQEFGVEAHLLVRSLLLCASQHFDEAAARELGRAQWTGIAACTARRLKAALGISGGGAEAVAKVIQLHPSFQPRSYVDVRVELEDEATVRVALRDCPALQEADACSWFGELGREPHSALDAMAWGVDARARAIPAESKGSEKFAWKIVVDAGAAAREAPRELAFANLSKGAAFRFTRRRPLRGE